MPGVFAISKTGVIVDSYVGDLGEAGGERYEQMVVRAMVAP